MKQSERAAATLATAVLAPNPGTTEELAPQAKGAGFVKCEHLFATDD